MDDPIESLGANVQPPLDPEELATYKAFLRSLLPTPPHDPPQSLWHYTSGAGLIGILRSGRLFATHVSCLNDTLEYQYLASLLLDESRARATREPDPAVRALHEGTINALSSRDVTRAGIFVTCFSREKDDLGQWRGYGGGDSSYAIEFDYSELFKRVGARRPETGLWRASYDAKRHQTIVSAIVENQIQLAQRGLRFSPEQGDKWFETWGRGYAAMIDLLHAAVKHPKFESEKEYRILVKLRDGEEKDIQFTAKDTLLSRHLEMDWTEEGKLPIRSVMVGPGRWQAVSKISVGDLLRKHGYEDLPVTLSEVPYRTV